MSYPSPPRLDCTSAAAQNGPPIATAIAPFLARPRRVLELGSGSGEHALAFAARFGHCHWQPSEQPPALARLRAQLDRAGRPANLAAPIALDAGADHWPEMRADLLYSANTLHIIAWPLIVRLFSHCGRLLPAGGEALFYGPFQFADRPFTASNAAFDRALRRRDPGAGVRAVDALVELAGGAGLALRSAIDMPVNNHILVFERSADERSAPPQTPPARPAP